MVDDEVFAGLGCKTFPSLTHSAFFLPLAGGLSEIGGRTADIVDVSLEIGKLCQKLRFLDYGFLASCRDRPSLVISDRAEITCSVTAADVIDGKLDFFNGGHSAERFVGGMVCSLVRKLVDVVKLSGFERRGRWILYNDLFAVALNDRFAANGVVLVLLNTAGTGVCEITFRCLGLDLVKGGTFNRGGDIGVFIRGNRVSRSENVVHHRDGLSVLQTARDLDDLMLAHTEHQKIRIGIHQNGGTNAVIPVIIVGKSAQRCFQSAYAERNIAIDTPNRF